MLDAEFPLVKAIRFHLLSYCTYVDMLWIIKLTVLQRELMDYTQVDLSLCEIVWDRVFKMGYVVKPYRSTKRGCMND